MNVFLNDQKIGYTHRSIKKTDDGPLLEDETFLKMNIMGMVQDLFIKTSGRLHADYTLSAFRIDISSGAFDFTSRGEVTGPALHIVTGEEKTILPVKGPVYLYAGLLDALRTSALYPGKTLTFDVFDPVTAAIEPVSLVMEGKEVLALDRMSVDTTRLKMQYKGLSQYAWMDENGNILRETGPMGMRLEKTIKPHALAGFNVTRMEDLTEVLSVPSNRVIERPDELSWMKMKLTGVNNHFAMDGGRQEYEKDILAIKKEVLAPRDRHDEREESRFLSPGPMVQSDHKKIKEAAANIILASDPPMTRAKKILDWVHANIEKQPVVSVPDALQTLLRKKGDCNEHAVLFAALARAAGIPTQIETGLVYMKGRFYYHAWNVVYLGDWITADATLGQIPADVTHIRLIRGDITKQTDLIHAIGAIQIEILETAHDPVK